MLLRKIFSYSALTADEMDALEDLQGSQVRVARGALQVHADAPQPSAYVLCDGWCLVFKKLANGERQVMDIRVPGDFIGIERILYRAGNIHTEAITEVVVRPIRSERLLSTFQSHERLGKALMWTVSRDMAVANEHLVDVAKRSSLERTAHFFLEVWKRLDMVGLAAHDGYDCPLSQLDLADLLGMTAIHLNRVLRQLREANLTTFRDGRVTFGKIEKLIELTGFDVTYLEERSSRPNGI